MRRCLVLVACASLPLVACVGVPTRPGAEGPGDTRADDTDASALPDASRPADDPADTDDASAPPDPPVDTGPPEDTGAVVVPDLSGALVDLTAAWIGAEGRAWTAYGTDRRVLGSQGTPTVLCRREGRLLAVLGGLVDDPRDASVFVPVVEVTATGLSTVGRLSDTPGAGFPSDGPTDVACADLDGDGLPELVFSGGVVQDGRWIYRGATGTPPWQGRVDGVPWVDDLDLTSLTNLTPARVRPGALPDLVVSADGPDGYGRLLVLLPVARGDGGRRTVTWLPHEGLVDPTGHLPSAYVVHTPTRKDAQGGWRTWVLALGDVPTTGTPELASGIFELVDGGPDQAGTALAAMRLAPRDPVPATTPWSQRPGVQQGRSNLNLLSPMGSRVVVHPAVGAVLVVSTTFEASPMLRWGDPWAAPPATWEVLGGSGGWGLPLVTFPSLPAEESYGRYWGLGGDAQALLVAMGRDQACRVEPCMPDASLTPRLFWDATRRGDYVDVTDQTVLAGLGGSWHAVTTGLLDDGRYVYGLGSKYNTEVRAAWPRVLAEQAVQGERFVGVRLLPHRSLPGGQGSWVRLEARDGSVLGRALVDGSGSPAVYATPDGVRFRVPAGRHAGRVCVSWVETALEQCVDAEGAEGSVIEVVEPPVLEVDDAVPLVLGEAPGVFELVLRCPPGRTCLPPAVAETRFGAVPEVAAVAAGWRVRVRVPTAAEAGPTAEGADAPFAARWQRAFGTSLRGVLPLELELRDAGGVIWRGRVAPFLEAPL